jgi:uncharacterized protein (TIGR01777 family)
MYDDKTHKIAVSGATGFVGSNLIRAFEELNWEIVPLGRKDFKGKPKDLAKRMQGVDIIINLAGAPITERWTEEYKKIMCESRIHLTRKIVDACRLMSPGPQLLISTSAVGYYATRGIHTEEKYVKADNFLGHLAEDWEKEAMKAKEIGIRTIIFRFGIVLGRDGGALKKMLIPFKSGMGGTIGDGSQAFSWIHIKDLIRAYTTAIDNPAYEGIYNLTSPHPTTNKGLTMSLGKVLHRPALLRVPKFVLRLQLGEGAQVLAEGQSVLPKRLLDSGFAFSFQEIEEAVKDCVS